MTTLPVEYRNRVLPLTEEGYVTSEIAEVLGTSGAWVRSIKALHRSGLPMAPKSRANKRTSLAERGRRAPPRASQGHWKTTTFVPRCDSTDSSPPWSWTARSTALCSRNTSARRSRTSAPAISSSWTICKRTRSRGSPKRSRNATPASSSAGLQPRLQPHRASLLEDQERTEATRTPHHRGARRRLRRIPRLVHPHAETELLRGFRLLAIMKKKVL